MLQRNRLVLRVTTGTPKLLEDPCPACGGHGMIELPLLHLTVDGVTEVGTTRICDDCHRNAAE